jgi:histone acetyltransferase (RNA polymerase elongator complex component)
MQGCPYPCIYCDQNQFADVSVQPAEELFSAIDKFIRLHPQADKQIAFYGGTFTALPERVRSGFLDNIISGFDAKTSVRISTRPDCIDADILRWCREHRIKTIELGIQDFSDIVLLASRRGYNSATAISACKMVLSAGFELGIQLMPGLPAANAGTLEYNHEVLLDLKPNFLRLYPLIFIAGTELWQLYLEGRHSPLDLEAAIDICADYYSVAAAGEFEIIKCGVPPIRHDCTIAGPYHPAFGELVLAEVLCRQICQNYRKEQTLEISTRDVSLLIGHQRFALKKLLKRLDLCSIKVRPIIDIARGSIRFSDALPLYEWSGTNQ